MFGGKKKDILDAKLKDSIKKTLNRNRDCYYKADSKHTSPAIRSHSVWKSGILKLLEKNNEVYWISPNDRFRIFGDKKELFSPVVLKNATVYRGFCDSHDREIFKKIEKDEKYVGSQLQMFLYSYRAFSYQHVQDTLSTEAYELLVEEARKLYRLHQLNNKETVAIQTMVNYIKAKSQRRDPIFERTSKAFDDIFRLLEVNGHYMRELDNNFILKSYKLKSKIECACSGIGDPVIDSKGERINRANTGYLFYNLFPQDEISSYFIVGLKKSDEKAYYDIINYLEQEYQNYEMGNGSMFLLAVQNLIVNGSENIILSPDLHAEMEGNGELNKLVEQFEGSVAQDINTQISYQDIKRNYGFSLL